MEFENSEFQNSEFKNLEFENLEFKNLEFENSEFGNSGSKIFLGPTYVIPILAVKYRYLTPMKLSTDNGVPLKRDTQ